MVMRIIGSKNNKKNDEILTLKKIKFNGNIYPYVEFPVWSFKKAKDISIKVSTKELETALKNALLQSKDDELHNKAENFDTDFRLFVDQSKLRNPYKQKLYDEAMKVLDI